MLLKKFYAVSCKQFGRLWQFSEGIGSHQRQQSRARAIKPVCQDRA